MLLRPETIERSGKSVDEIVRAVAGEYRVPVESLKVEVLEEQRDAFLGFIGGNPARVRITVLPDPRDIAEAFVHDVVEMLNPEARCELEENGHRFTFHVEGLDVGNLIGKHGATLNALQYLANIVSNRYEGTPKLDVVVDVSGYRDSRSKSLRELAHRLSEKVLQSGRAIELEPMPAAERKIIHLELKELGEVSTYSIGEEPNRRLVIAPPGAEGEAAPVDGERKRRGSRRPRRAAAPRED